MQSNWMSELGYPIFFLEEPRVDNTYYHVLLRLTTSVTRERLLCVLTCLKADLHLTSFLQNPTTCMPEVMGQAHNLSQWEAKVGGLPCI